MDLLPLPRQFETLDGTFRLTPGTVIQADPPNRPNAAALRRMLAASGFRLPVREPGARTPAGTLRLALDPSLELPGEEAYRLQVRADGVDLAGRTPAGVFRGLQTLRQLLPVEAESDGAAPIPDWSLPACRVLDAPRFAWRGFMLDEGRHFQGKQTVLKLLDLMALFKLNVFHWHLTDDQGWRVEIKKYPRLTEVGSRRAGTRRSFFGRDHDGRAHAGFYTQDEIRAVVAYAAERHITIVPEIEMPGHSIAALASYPELSCSGGPFEVATRFGIFTDIFCAGKEAAFQFLEGVLDEILDLFPSPFIHIGGDEVPKKRWQSCPDCQARMRRECLKDRNALQVYFTNRLVAFLEARGRRAVGWNEILGPGLSDQAVVQYWVGKRRALLESIRRDGRQVVMSNFLDTYLDHSHELMPLSRAYAFEPVPPELEGGPSANVLGLEFPLWGEWLPTGSRLEYQAFPRLLALAETGWTARERKDLADFRRRLEAMLPRLERRGIRYAPLAEAEPPRLKRWFSAFTIAQPQNRTAGPGRNREDE